MYSLLDSGDEMKLEQFGDYSLARPAAGAVWKKQKPQMWDEAHAHFSRVPKNEWTIRKKIAKKWKVELSGLQFHVEPSDFGHLGIFPEHETHWRWMEEQLQKRKGANVLNLFAYTGAATLAAARAGAHVCHLDASKPMVALAKENAKLNHLIEAPIRWIVEDVQKFMEREIRRKKQYDAIVLDPPTFGRGPNGELFKIEKQISHLLMLCKKLLSDHPLFILFTCHTPGYTPTTLFNLLRQTFAKGEIACGETLLEGDISLPAGSFARWTP